jgi:hypothetical protein
MNPTQNSMNLFSVFYLVGGYGNFRCQPVIGKFSYENAQAQVREIERMGYKAIAVSNGKTGFLSFSDFASAEEAKSYHDGLMVDFRI